jgi:serine/threonine-protein kinase
LRVSTITTADFATSATGTLVFTPAKWTRDRNLAWIDRNGMMEVLSAPVRPYSAPRVSPDGQQIVVWTPGADLLIYNLRRGTLSHAVSEGSNPIWSFDGQHVAYRAAREGTRNIFWKAADGSSAEERLTTGEDVQTPSSWTPDGSVMLLDDVSAVTGIDLLVFRAKDRKTEVFLQTPAGETRARFSPDGRWVAYDSNESGRNEVYVRPFPGLGARHQISNEGGMEPVWNPNGRELFYRNGDSLMAVATSTGAAFTAGTPRVLFRNAYLTSSVTSRSYDVSRDGQRFLFAIPTKPPVSGTQIDVVLNWFEELKEKVPAGK